MSLTFPFVEGISEKLWRILRSHKIKSTLKHFESTYIESTLPKLLCKPRDQKTTEVKNNIVYEIGCTNCEAVPFGESKKLF